LNARPIFAFLVLFAALPAQTPITGVSRDTKLRLLEIINRDRADAGVSRLRFSDELSRIADEHCREMLREGYSSHWDLAGWKPYLRYASAGLNAYTSENISSLWETAFPLQADKIWDNIEYGHRAFMQERPPNDGHRQSILDPHHTMAGIGLAYDGHGMRLIEIFGAKYAELDALPQRASLSDILRIHGRVSDPDLTLLSISVYYEPLPHAMSVEALRRTSSYSLPDEEFSERPILTGGQMYSDRKPGIVEVKPSGEFSAPLKLWKGQPGVYIVAVWLRRGKDKGFIGAMAPVLVNSR
jgi:uncharacterized protein YkwD